MRAAASRRSKRLRRLVLETLEERLVMATDLQAISLQALSATLVEVRYEVVGDPAPVPFRIGVFRSPDDILSSQDVPIGQIDVSGSQLSTGVHEVTITVDPMVINPSLRYALVGLDIPVDPNDPLGQVVESDETGNNVAGFRKWVVAAVTHGRVPDGVFPSWVTDVANQLEGLDYDEAVAIDWAAASVLPTPGITTAVAQETLSELADAIAALPGLGPTDVVDLHLIGHSRGGSVMSQAAGSLAALPHTQGGFKKLTMLDPHPARNGPTPFYSASPGPIGRFGERLFVTFQAGTDDPELVIPAGLDQAEMFYQQALYTNTVRPDERIVNSWGNAPAVSSSPLTYYNLTTIVPSHEGLVLAYASSVLPTLATAAPVPFPTTPPPPVPTNGGGTILPMNRRLTSSAFRYEHGLLVASGVRPGVARHLLVAMARVNLVIDHGRPRIGVAAIYHLAFWIQRQRGFTIPAPLADSLTQLLIYGRTLLYPSVQNRAPARHR